MQRDRPSSSDSTQNTTAYSTVDRMPPSEPRPSRGSLASLDAMVDRPARLQVIVASMLALVLVVIPLYLWRRPRAESIPVSRAGAPANAFDGLDPAPAGVEEEPKVTMTEPRVLACMDPGPRKTPADRCDHLADVEGAFVKAIEDSISCLPKDASGSIQYVADVSFKRKLVGVYAPKDGRTIKSAKMAGACASAVRARMKAFSLEGVAHQHARYKIAVTATYPGGKKP